MPDVSPLLFFGTPDFSVPTLAALVEAGHVPALVVTQPARPVGRGRKEQDPPVAQWARERGLAVRQPERVREPGFLEELREIAPAVAVVVAFGQIFPRDLLALPRQGCINLHASLLPRWRGAAPIQAVLAAGETETGVTTMQMEAGLDTGPILLQEALAIGPAETVGELSARLAAAGATLVVETLARLAAGTLVATPQDGALATYAPRLTRESGRVDWTREARAIYDGWRAWTPWPGLTAELRGEPVKLVAVEPSAGEVTDRPPGTFLALRAGDPGSLAVACGGGSVLALRTLQRPGRKPLRAADFANGEHLQPGERFA
ncbi:MAG TPA: methionyl-tRNA formyltransferase [Acidobacteria bacterium]|nr:methionyl-tRNA formyltransferase [Acidobacteriota bacterium]